MNLKEIWVGWKNYLLQNPQTKELAERRLAQCASCTLLDNGVCSPKRQGIAVADFDYDGDKRVFGEIYNGCGCVVKAKANNPDSKCPLGKF